MPDVRCLWASSSTLFGRLACKCTYLKWLWNVWNDIAVEVTDFLISTYLSYGQERHSDLNGCDMGPFRFGLISPQAFKLLWVANEMTCHIKREKLLWFITFYLYFPNVKYNVNFSDEMSSRLKVSSNCLENNIYLDTNIPTALVLSSMAISPFFKSV